MSSFDGTVKVWSITGTHSPPAKLPEAKPEAKPNYSQAQQEQLKHGESVSQTLCVTCHVQPEPSVLSSENWDLALKRDDAVAGDDAAGTTGNCQPPTDLNACLPPKIFPSAPVISIKQWTDVCFYYINKSEFEKPVTLES